MSFHSVLFQKPSDRASSEGVAVPDFFVDLNLDQIVAAITAGKEEYDLNPFFYTSLHDVDAIKYRHEIMQDLEDSRLRDTLNAFAIRMQALRRHLARSGKLRDKLQKERWFIDAADVYCDAVTHLVDDLAHASCRSRGLSAFREALSKYAASERFASLLRRTRTLKADLASIHYCLLIDGLTVEVRPYKEEPDYSEEVETTFDRFEQGVTDAYVFDFTESPDMNHVEAKILDLVAQSYPDVFKSLDSYCAEQAEFVEPTIRTFDREIQFYTAYLEHIATLKNAGLDFCYPRLSEAKQVHCLQGFDLALAGKLIGERATPVCNDFHLDNRERIIVVSGPNQGGKTTFARMFGQLHYLASLGCPVPGKEAQLSIFDKLFTHFEREENVGDLRGRLQADLMRVHEMLEGATPKSIIIMNEAFTATTMRDALVLSKKIAAKIMDLDLLCVWVTFLDELSLVGEQTISMVSTVVPDNPALRSFKIVRRPADGLAYAMSIAELYRLTYDSIEKRLGQ